MTLRWRAAAITIATLGNRTLRSLCRALVLSCAIIGYASLGFGQASDPKSTAIIEQIMTTALSRCYSTVDGVKRITFEPATNQEFAEVKALGQEAVAPLERYLDLQRKNGFTQLFAVKFLMAIGGSTILSPLKRALAQQDQWEVTRAAALDGIFSVSRDEARPYVKAALADKSPLVQRRAKELLALDQEQNNEEKSKR